MSPPPLRSGVSIRGEGIFLNRLRTTRGIGNSLINFLDATETLSVIVINMTALMDTPSGVKNEGGAVPADLVIKVESISSRQAASMLELHKGPNRRTSENQVLKFQADMESGRWHFEGGPVRISRTGKLLDGKHRLTALANTVPEMEIPFVVVYGLDDDAQLYMDQGQTRTVGQQLGLRGVSNGTLYGAVAKLYLEWTRGRLFRASNRGTTSKPEQTEWVISHQEILASLSETGFQQVDAPPSVVGAFTLAVLQLEPEKAVRFIANLVSGAGLAEGDPILALDRRLRNIRRSGVKVSQREYLAYFIKAWNAWVMGDRLQKLQLTSLTEESFPELLTVIKPKARL
jgi:hypothetical protein